MFDAIGFDACVVFLDAGFDLVHCQYARYSLSVHLIVGSQLISCHADTINFMYPFGIRTA